MPRDLVTMPVPNRSASTGGPRYRGARRAPHPGIAGEMGFSNGTVGGPGPVMVFAGGGDTPSGAPWLWDAHADAL